MGQKTPIIVRYFYLTTKLGDPRSISVLVGLTRQQHGIFCLCFLDVIRLPCEGTLINLEVVSLDEDAVGRQQVSCDTQRGTRPGGYTPGNSQRLLHPFSKLFSYFSSIPYIVIKRLWCTSDFFIALYCLPRFRLYFKLLLGRQ